MSSSSGRAVDDNEYLPTLLAEQEAAYGVNMFEYLAPDDPEVARLMEQFAFSRTDAMIAVFQQFPPKLASPVPPAGVRRENQNREPPRDPTGRSHHNNRDVHDMRGPAPPTIQPSLISPRRPPAQVRSHPKSRASNRLVCLIQRFFYHYIISF